MSYVQFEEMLARIYKEVKPMYEQLHAYVRRKLAQHYGEDKVNLNGAIPAHLLGKSTLTFTPQTLVGDYFTIVTDITKMSA